MKMNIGQTIEIIYKDKAGKITQRKMEIEGIRDGRIRATCLANGSLRVFLIASILAWQPVREKRHAQRHSSQATNDHDTLIRPSWTYATLQELETKSGRTPAKIREGMQELIDQNYIEWKLGTPTESTLILEGWEREDPAGTGAQRDTGQPQQTSALGNMDYWQYY